nr:MFS transporter [Rhizobium laguerreae]
MRHEKSGSVTSTAFTPLRNKVFRSIWTATQIASLGWLIQTTAISWLIATTSASDVMVALNAHRALFDRVFFADAGHIRCTGFR